MTKNDLLVVRGGLRAQHFWMKSETKSAGFLNPLERIVFRTSFFAR
jgi:hypothetical protein